jgi:hypothetical protein
MNCNVGHVYESVQICQKTFSFAFSNMATFFLRMAFLSSGLSENSDEIVKYFFSD